MADKNHIVYSTDPDWKPGERASSQEDNNMSHSNQMAYIERDRKKRKGKTVTVITGLKGNLKQLQKELQQHCGAGGSLKQNTMEIQGDHRDKIAAFLNNRGIKTKFRGG